MSKQNKMVAWCVNEWAVANSSQYAGESRKINDVVIGNYGDKPTDLSSIDSKLLIVEKIYNDIAVEIARKSKKYKVEIDIHAVPHVVVSSNNELVIHNEEMNLLVQNIKMILKTIPDEMKIKATLEFQIARRKPNTKLGYMVKAVCNVIRQNSGQNIHTSLIELILMEEWKNEYCLPTKNHNKVEVFVHQLSNLELLSAKAGIVELQKTQKCTISPIEEFMKNNDTPITAYENSINKEIADRFFLGTLTLKEVNEKDEM